MSTITVVRKGNKACIAAETLTSFGPTKLSGDLITHPTKIHKWGNSYIGIVGYVALAVALEEVFATEPEPDFSSRQSVFAYFNKLHKKLKKKYFVNPSEGNDAPVESSQFELVILNEHGIFGVHSLREVYEFNQFWAYGSGRDYAIGAIHALYGLEYDAEYIAKQGVATAILFDDASGGEIHSHVIEFSTEA
jgi:ATP-dependent HslUV protease, peptidase subunit HslV